MGIQTGWLAAALGAALLGSFPAWAVCTGASPTWNCGNTYAELNGLLNGASPAGFVRGDVVNVSAGSGTVSWGATLSLTKGVKLIGPGRDNLSVAIADPGLSISPDATAIGNEETIKVAGFTFNGTDSAAQMIHVTGAGATSAKAFKNLVLLNNRFKDPSQSSSTVIYQTGQVRGVVANNLFDRPMIVARCFGNDLKIEHSNGNFPVTYGSSDNLYYEDNTFQWPTAGGASGFPGWVECGQGGRVVMRYNTWAMANAVGQDEIWDIHGFQNWPNGQTGTMGVEYYGNSITNKLGYRTLFHRGGKGLYHNNLMTGSSGSGADISNHDQGCHNDIDSTWPLPFVQTNDVHYWNNTYNGSTQALTLYPAADNYNADCPPIEGAHWWKENASCTASACSSGIGKGAAVPSGTCTVGTGFWVASMATATTNPSVVQSGKLYKCTAPDTWSQFYAPYVYPHPLRSGGELTAPAPPTNLVAW